jgi:hypothetical protein
VEVKIGVKYVLSFLLFFFYWVATSFLGNMIREYGMNTFILYPYTIYFVTIQYLIGGMLLGIPSLLRYRDNPGNWKFDYKKFAGAGIPALYVGLHSLFYFFTPFMTLPSFFHLSISLQEPMLILSGFILLSSFYKEKGRISSSS